MRRALVVAHDWDYAYQYLAAGVNTGNGWQTWNTNGQFPLWYAQDGALHGYTPVFPCYMLLQSAAPACDGFAENRQDLCSLCRRVRSMSRGRSSNVSTSHSDRSTAKKSPP